jgi:Lrp/AsnC family transcriptional regulator
VLKIALIDAARVIQEQATEHNPTQNIVLRSLSQTFVYHRSQNARFLTVALGYYPSDRCYMEKIDKFDRKILNALQADAAISLDQLGETIGLSRNACWHRVKAMETSGVTTKRVALIDPTKVDLGQMVFMKLRTNRRDPKWQQDFSNATNAISGILSVYRMARDLDYLIRERVSDMADYDRLYQLLITRLPIADIAASL